MWPQAFHPSHHHHSKHHHHHHHVPSVGLTPYSPLKQREHWGEKEGHAVIDWGVLFFDLFYVGGAYNLAGILKEDTSLVGILYFAGCFGGVLLIWNRKLLFDSSFAVMTDDLWHRAYDMSHLVVLATAILHIRPVGLLAHPTQSVEMFSYALALLLDSIMVAVAYVEVMLYVEGGPEAKITARRELTKNAVTMMFYLAATTVAGVEFYIDGAGSVAANIDAAVDEYQHTDTDTPSSDDEANHISIALIICGWAVFGVSFLWDAFIFYPRVEDIRKVTVPVNAEYVIHRHGEWIMLMLGESVLSLLIVQISYGMEYYVTFYCGLLSVIFFQSLHYRSQPHHAEEHAMRRSTKAGTFFFLLMQLYSMALVALGASYKLLLTEHIYDDGYTEDYLYGMSRMRRSLGGEELPRAERIRRIAVLFTTSLAIAFVILDLMILCHKGLKENLNRLKSGKGVVVTLVRLGLIAFVATFSLYVNEPQILSVAGLVAIICQVIVRVAGSVIFPMGKISKESIKSDVDRESERSTMSNLIFSIFYSPLYHIKGSASSSDSEKKDAIVESDAWFLPCLYFLCRSYLYLGTKRDVSVNIRNTYY